MARKPDMDLWPNDIAPPDVRQPRQILEHQASLIESKTGGRIRGEVAQEVNQGRITLSFLLTDASSGYRVRIFYCTHGKDVPYPVTVYAQQLNTEKDPGMRMLMSMPAIPANTQDEFTSLLSKVFYAGETRAAVQAILARQSDAEAAKPAESKDKDS